MNKLFYITLYIILFSFSSVNAQKYDSSSQVNNFTEHTVEVPFSGIFRPIYDIIPNENDTALTLIYFKPGVFKKKTDSKWI